MPDIVERLRSVKDEFDLLGAGQLIDEAAVEIERLRAHNERLMHILCTWKEGAEDKLS